MNNFDVQRLLAAAGYYTGAIDGIIGPNTNGAIAILISNHYAQNHQIHVWTKERRAIAAGQLVLKYAGYEVGEIDGWVGNMTTGAMLQWNHYQTYGKKLALHQTPVTDIKTKFPRQRDCGVFYGQPGIEIEHQLEYADAPYKLRIDYDLSKTRNRLRLHSKCIDSAIAAMENIAKAYSPTERVAYGIDRFAGDYFHRKMRGGDSWSMHAYGCAIDFYAAPNGLTTRCPQALFCKPEYKTFFDIWESHGWVSLGRAIGRDWMHVQAAGL